MIAMLGSEMKKLRWRLDLFLMKLYTLRRIRLIMAFAASYLQRGVRAPASDSESGDQFRYRSLLYTLLMANYVSLSLIARQERYLLPTDFDYVDSKLVVRAMTERFITQKYILTDPQRLADMFVYWGRVEGKRFHDSRDTLERLAPESSALALDFEGSLEPWTAEMEADYLECLAKWEALAHQRASKAKSWSGLSLAEMAKHAGLEDFYKVTYRETSWYTHGLVRVADFFLRNLDDQPVHYSSSTTTMDRIECFIQAEWLFVLSFECADSALGWNAAKRLSEMRDRDAPPLAWLWQWFLSYFL